MKLSLISRPVSLLAVLLLSATSGACASVPDRAPAPPPASGTNTPPAPPYETRAVHDPNGIGKFYMGREIAQVMGHQAADWLERPEREREEKPSVMIDSLGLKPGDVVADIGAGSGYISFRLAQKVAPNGIVYAEEIQPEMLAIIRQKMQQNGVKNVKTILGTITDPKLPANSVDLILMVDVYHEFDHPWEMAHSMIQALKPGGRLVFVEYRLEDPAVPIKTLHKMSVEQVRKEMSVQPVHYVESIETLPRQHIIIFRK